MSPTVSYNGYDITLAVEARRMLMIEVHPLSECIELVYAPTQELIKQSSKTMAELLCFRGQPHVFRGFKGFFVDIDMVLPEKRIVYLGRIINRKQAQDLFEWHMRICQKSPDKVALLRKRGPMGITMERVGCKIPVDYPQLNNEALEKGVRRYMDAFIPQLGNLPIRWVSREKGEKFRQVIWEIAQKASIKQTREETREILKGEF